MTPFLAFLDIGPFELLLLAAAAVVLFGGDLPDVARKAARVIGRLRAMSADLTQELSRPSSELRKHLPRLDRPDELDLSPDEHDLLAPPRLKDGPPDVVVQPGPVSNEPASTAGGDQPPAPLRRAPDLPPDPARLPRGSHDAPGPWADPREDRPPARDEPAAPGEAQPSSTPPAPPGGG